MLDTLQPLSYAIVTIFFVLSTTTILLRTYSRGFIVKNFGWDDWCMLSILFFNAGQLAILYYFLKHGGGLHVQVVVAENPQWISKLIYALFVEEIYYMWMHWIIKMAFLLFYLRFANTKIFRNLVYGTMGLNTLFVVVTWIMYCLQCRPLDAYFHPAAHPTVKCLDKSVQAFVPATFNVFIDILIVVLPIRPLWKIQVSLRKRLGLITIVSLGAAVVLVSSLRMIVLHEFEKTADITFVLGKLIIISSIELDVAIIAANAPSMKTFWSRHISGSAHTGADDSTPRTNKDLVSKRRTLLSQASCHAMNALSQPSPGSKSSNQSSEDLWKNESAIVVTSSVGIERSSFQGEPELEKESYNKFGEV